MDDGMVWVRPGMFETKVIVAPNSPIAFAKDKIEPVTNPGSIKGTVIVKYTRIGEAPKVPATCSNFGLIRSCESRRDLTISGRDIKNAASTAPVHWKAKLKLNKYSKSLPIGPFLPKSINRK